MAKCRPEWWICKSNEICMKHHIEFNLIHLKTKNIVINCILKNLLIPKTEKVAWEGKLGVGFWVVVGGEMKTDYKIQNTYFYMKWGEVKEM